MNRLRSNPRRMISLTGLGIWSGDETVIETETVTTLETQSKKPWSVHETVILVDIVRQVVQTTILVESVTNQQPPSGSWWGRRHHISSPEEHDNSRRTLQDSYNRPREESFRRRVPCDCRYPLQQQVSSCKSRTGKRRRTRMRSAVGQ